MKNTKNTIESYTILILQLRGQWRRLDTQIRIMNYQLDDISGAIQNTREDFRYDYPDINLDEEINKEYDRHPEVYEFYQGEL